MAHLLQVPEGMEDPGSPVSQSGAGTSGFGPIQHKSFPKKYMWSVLCMACAKLGDAFDICPNIVLHL